ncbi:hypothetical protein [Pedosphaera parvula]|nr:hypothetical protein [Pedosphaera parvula]
MKRANRSSVHFSALVKACGRPEPVTLWTDPSDDKRFMSAVRQNRVLTVEQQNVGTGKDIGIIGFLKEKNASYLVFPKSLNRFSGMEVNGIKYELVNQPEAEASISSFTKTDRKNDTRPSRPKKHFSVVLQWTATVNTTHEIEARNLKQAREQALNEQIEVDFSTAKKAVKILEIREM